jgi:hypothetical protein
MANMELHRDCDGGPVSFASRKVRLSSRHYNPISKHKYLDSKAHHYNDIITGFISLLRPVLSEIGVGLVGDLYGNALETLVSGSPILTLIRLYSSISPGVFRKQALGSVRE